MKAVNKVISFVWEKLLVLSGVLLVLLPSSPLNMPLSYRDLGVFLYAGWRIINGSFPYRDVWDHKPPIIYFINALGVFFRSGSHWGVWLLELIALFAAAFVGFRIVKRLLGTYPAFFSLYLWLFALVFVIEGGNLTTEFSLPLQFIALWLVFDSNKPNFPKWRWFLLGFIGATSFFTKQTTIGIWSAIFIYMTFNRLNSGQVKQWIIELLLYLSGFAVIILSFTTYFSLNKMLQDFWSAAFEFNLLYSSSSISLGERLKFLYDGIGDLSRIGLFQFSMVGFIIGLFIVNKKSLPLGGNPVLTVSLIALPIEWLLLLTSGRAYPHYFMTILPVLSIFAATTYWALDSWLSSLGNTNKGRVIFLISVIGVYFWSFYSPYVKQINVYSDVGNPTIIKYIKSNTNLEDYVLIWGGESDINYFSQRASPTQFVYQYPLYEPKYVNEGMILDFLNDILTNRPRLILDTNNPSTPMYDFPIKTNKIETAIRNIQSGYRIRDIFNRWTVYEYKGFPESP